MRYSPIFLVAFLFAMSSFSSSFAATQTPTSLEHVQYDDTLSSRGMPYGKAQGSPQGGGAKSTARGRYMAPRGS